MAGKARSEADAVEPYDALACTHTSLRRAARQLTQLYDEALSPVGLTSAQALLMAQLHELGGAPGDVGPSLQTLSKRLAIQISALTHALRPLMRDGLITVAPDSADRRIKRAALTEEGLRQTRRMYALWRKANRRIEMALGEGAAEQLRLLANRVASPDFRKTLEGTATE
jgi:DNA-binding MarR family transcriptional regulator